MPEPMADRLRTLVAAYPGLHVRELARQLGTSVALVEYHLRGLAKQIELRPDGRFRRAYLRGGPHVPAAQRRALDVLRRRWPLGIALELLQGPLRHGELAGRLGLGKGKLSFHLRALEGAGVVERDEAGAFRLCSDARLRSLLETWRPTPDLLDEFSEAWEALYRS